MFEKIKFESIFQAIILIVLSIYVFKGDDPDNIKLIIGAFIGVLSNVPKLNYNKSKGDQVK